MAPQIGQLDTIITECVVVQHLRQRFRRATPRSLVSSLLSDARLLSLCKRVLQLAQSQIRYRVVVSRYQQPGAGGITLKLIFGALQIVSHLAHLLFERLASTSCRLYAPFDAVGNELTGERIDDVRGELGIGGLVENLNHARLARCTN